MPLTLSTLTLPLLLILTLATPNERTAQYVMLLVVTLGVVMNALMLQVAVKRRLKTRAGGRPTAGPKAEIARLTMKRTVRIELGFLAAQLARLCHTVYVIHVGIHNDTFAWAVVERTFVTLLLVYLSIADVFDRNKIKKLLSRLPDGERLFWE